MADARSSDDGNRRRSNNMHTTRGLDPDHSHTRLLPTHGAYTSRSDRIHSPLRFPIPNDSLYISRSTIYKSSIVYKDSVSVDIPQFRLVYTPGVE